jgi:integrase
LRDRQPEKQRRPALDPAAADRRQTLKEWRLACPKGTLDLVFPNTIGGVEVLHIITAALEACRLAAGIKGEGRGPKYGMHAFRHGKS